MTLLFYCQHSVGMGHLVRSSALAEELARRFDVIFLNGGAVPPGLPFPATVERIDLPPLGMREDHSLVSLTSALEVADALAVRRDTMLRLLRARQPDVILVELFPFGRKKFEPELLPLLDAAHGQGRERPLVVCSLRDLLVTARRNQQGFDDRAQDLCDRYFDLVLVHTDPAFARLEESFTPSTPLRTPLAYTGFMTRGGDALSATGTREGIVISAGGGQVGDALFRAAVAAHDRIWPRFGLPMTIVAGPFAPAAVLAELEAAARGRAGLTVLPSVPSLAPLLARARASVSQCGYNTALDLLRCQVPALVVPFAEGRENEQSRRAARLEERGLIRTLDSTALTPDRLADEIAALLTFSPSRVGLQMDGAAVTGAMLIAHLEARAAHDAPAAYAGGLL